MDYAPSCFWIEHLQNDASPGLLKFSCVLYGSSGPLLTTYGLRHAPLDILTFDRTGFLARLRENA